ncbi:MAG: protein kinase [Planctomycetes bacterium]|nr:protein kinase [Planctomycetota bacterium]
MKSEKEIFFEALEQDTPTERAAFLDEVCAGDLAKRQRVQALLDEHLQQDAFMQRAASGHDLSLDAEPVPAERPGAIVGRYKLLQQIGEGGCGVVYLAEQLEPVRRRVALKVIKLGMDTKSVVTRFEAERQALALMDHPNIARVLDAGATDTGRPYFVMELVPGLKLTDYCDQNRLPTRERLDLFIQVCHAVQHAHQKGVIHRDLKASNILVSLQDGVPVPKVIDFGIAKATGQGRLTDKTLFTAFEQCIGTPAYMSPEQAERSGQDIDTRSDIYSLGVLLYELLTGRTPFETKDLLEAGVDEMRRIIREWEPPKPSTRLGNLPRADLTTAAQHRRTEAPKLVHLVRGDLDWIVMKALEKDRTRRYESAHGLAVDVERHLAHEPVTACPPGAIYWIRKFVRRNRKTVGAAAVVVVALVLGVLATTCQWIRAEQAQRRAEAAMEDAQRHGYASDMTLAQDALAADDLGKAKALLDRYRPGSGREALRGFEWRYLAAQARTDAVIMDTNSTLGIRSLALSRDGKVLAVAREGGVIELRNPDTLQLRETLQADGQADALLAFSPTEDLLAATRHGGFVRFWRLDSRQAPNELQVSKDGQPRCLKFTPDGKRLALFDTEALATVWDVETGEKLWQSPQFKLAERATHGTFDVSPDGLHVAVGDRTGDIAIHNWAENRMTRRFKAHDGAISCLAYSPNGDLLASGTFISPYAVCLWNPQTGKLVGTFTGHNRTIHVLRFSGDGERLIGGGWGQMIRIWKVDTQELIRKLRGHTDWIRDLALSGDGATLLSGTITEALARWDLNDDGRRDLLTELPLVGSSRLNSLWSRTVFVGNGEAVIDYRPGGPDKGVNDYRPGSSLHLFDLSQAPEAVPLEVLGTDNARFAVAPRSGLLACVRPEGTMRVWSLRTMNVVTNIALEHCYAPFWNTPFFTLAEDRLILIEGPDESRAMARTFEARTWRQVHESEFDWPSIHTDKPIVRVCPNGSMLVTGGRPGWLTWIDLERGITLGKEKADPFAIQDLAFSPDGARLASAHTDGGVAFWDVSTRRRIVRWKAEPVYCAALAFSPDGERLATVDGGGEPSVRLWDLRISPYRETLVVPLEPGCFHHVEFSPDGGSLMLTSPSENVARAYVWRVPSFTELDGLDATDKRQEPAFPQDWALKATPPGRITQQPKGRVRNAGDPVEFLVQVTGEAPLYQWHHEDEELAGETNAWLHLAAISPPQAGLYQVSVRWLDRPDLPPLMSRPASLQVRQGGLLFGALRREHYRGILGYAVSDLTNHVRYPDQPDKRDTIPKLDMLRPEQEDMYGTRLTGYLLPPVSGSYIFYIASDNESTLSLSMDDNPTGRQPVAHQQGNAFWREWRSQAAAVSAPIHLEAGRRYSVEVLHKENDRGDHVAVAWQLPDQPPPIVGGPAIQGRYLACPDVPQSAQTE